VIDSQTSSSVSRFQGTVSRSKQLHCFRIFKVVQHSQSNYDVGVFGSREIVLIHSIANGSWRSAWAECAPLHKGLSVSIRAYDAALQLVCPWLVEYRTNRLNLRMPSWKGFIAILTLRTRVTHLAREEALVLEGKAVA
jgi:hypothetical protein